MKKKILGVALTLLLGLSMYIPQNAHAATNQTGNEKEITKQTVITMFKSQSTSENMETRITADKNLKTFNSLSDAEQKEFVEALNDPKKLEEKTVVTVEDASETPVSNNRATLLRASTSRKNVGKILAINLLE